MIIVSLLIALLIVLISFLGFFSANAYISSDRVLNAKYERNMRSYEEKYNEWLEESEEIEQKLNLKKNKYDQELKDCNTGQYCPDGLLEDYKTKYDNVKKEYDTHQDNKPIEPKKDFY